MRVCRYDNDRLGIVQGTDVLDVSAALSEIPTQRWPIAMGDPLIVHWDKVSVAIKALLPELQRSLPAGVRVAVLSDRTTGIRASVRDVQITLVLAAFLVVLVIYAFLRTLRSGNSAFDRWVSKKDPNALSAAQQDMFKTICNGQYGSV